MKFRLKQGFSLIEVSMAVFVLALGVLALMALFPAGLREGVNAQSDMRQAMFADYVLSTARAAAAQPGVVNLSTFQRAFQQVAQLDVPGSIGQSNSMSEFSSSGGNSQNRRNRMFYRIWIEDSPSSATKGAYRVCVQSTDRPRAGSADSTFRLSSVYVTGVYFLGNQQHAH